MSGIIGEGKTSFEYLVERIPSLIIVFILGYGLVSIILDIIKWIGN